MLTFKFPIKSSTALLTNLYLSASISVSNGNTCIINLLVSNGWLICFKYSFTNSCEDTGNELYGLCASNVKIFIESSFIGFGELVIKINSEALHF